MDLDNNHIGNVGPEYASPPDPNPENKHKHKITDTGGEGGQGAHMPPSLLRILH
jgi:hypothetical protein